MRILLVSANFRPSVGGIERLVEVLAHSLAKRGHDVTVAACRTDGGALREESDGVSIVRIPATDVLDARLNVPYPLPSPVAAFRTLRRLVADADVINPQDAIYATSALSLLLARRVGVPSVLTQHVGFVPQQHAVLDVAQSAAIRTIGLCARQATDVVAYNPAVAEWARRAWRLRDVQVVSPGVPEAPHVDRDAVRRELGLRPDRFVALFVGRDVPKKGLDIFKGAVDPAYDLVAITDRPLGAGPVQLLPFVEPERLRELLCAVDAFVLPSESEGIPLALQEALVTGLPCVIAEGPGYRYYLGDHEVLFVERKPAAIRSSLLRLVGDEAFRDVLAQRARSAGLREFGVEQFTDGYEEVYGRAVNALRR